MQLHARARRGAQLELASRQADAFAHPGQAESGAVPGGKADPIVVQAQVNGAVAGGEAQTHLARAGVAGDVAQALERHPVQQNFLVPLQHEAPQGIVEARMPALLRPQGTQFLAQGRLQPELVQHQRR